MGSFGSGRAAERTGGGEGMAKDGVLVRCPVCRHEQAYAPPAFPCVCGKPVAPPVRHGPAVPLTHRTGADAWVTVRCAACGRTADWPRPELGCACGTVLRVAVEPHAADEGPVTREGVETDEGAATDEGVATDEGGVADEGSGADQAAATDEGTAADKTAAPTDDHQSADSDAGHPSLTPSHIPLPRTAPTPRPAFRPLPVCSAGDAVTTAALYLRWLGYEDVREAGPEEERPPSGTRLAALGVLAQVEHTVRETSLRDVECAWLTAMAHSATCVCFALCDFTPAARDRADELDVALFRIDLSGTPEPLNGAADELAATGA
ncbi:hypothetical protein [Streptomyces flavofungini]|uniref:hypothetical protein n=1 Tax=Streptomyces flavofungini TaxID=68200 RepID=UPI0025B03BFF|nr:hypothetical protein [Streptomyces flavofungini]WJV45425.1 hypothetical protein QUY26_07680 [Streptomyces flavofungini]